MKLKTLKDIGDKSLLLVWRKEIKEEAIKWIKWYHRHKRMPIRDFAQWVEFFNITEEDLDGIK